MIPVFMHALKQCKDLLKIPEPDLQSWTEDAREKWESIQALEKRIFNGITDCRTQIQHIAGERTLLQGETSATRRELEELSIIEEDIAGETGTAVKKKLDSIANIVGKDVLISTFLRQFQNDIPSTCSGRPQMPPSFPNSTVPAKVVQACQRYLHDAEEVEDWNYDTIINLLKHAHEEDIAIRAEIDASQQTRVPYSVISQQVNSNDIMPETQVDKGTEESHSFTNSSPPTVYNSSPVAREQVARSFDSRSSETPPIIRVSENEYDALLSVNMEQEEQIQSLQTSTRQLKSQLVRNAVFSTQIDPQCIAEYAADLGPSNPPETEPLKLVLGMQTLSIADYIDEMPMCPRLQDDKIYLECLLDITRVDSDEPGALIRAQSLSEQCLPWLLAKLPEILCRATDETATLLHNYISTVIAVIEPELFARATLFILVATFTQKFRHDSQKTLWWELQQAIEAGKYGRPYGNWDLLDRISFAWFMAVGPKTAGTLALGLDDSQARNLHTLIRAFRSVRVYDFVNLLEQPCIQSYAERDRSILLATPADEDQMIVMRTSRANGGNRDDGFDLELDYIWVRHRGKVYMSSDGLLLSIDDSETAVVLVQPSSNETLPSFSTQNPNLLRYICKFYLPEVSGIMSQ
jgi:hypothetical protein